MLFAVCALAIAVNAIGDHASVEELEQDESTPLAVRLADGGDRTHPAFDSGRKWQRQGTGYFKRIPNAPGPRHSLPGYKESHNWESDTDYFSPLVFDWQYYRARYLTGSEDELTTKKDYLANVIDKKDANGAADPAKAPDCRQGSAAFGPNEYNEANKDKTDVKLLGGDCKALISHYQKTGIFAAYPLMKNPAKYDDVSIVLIKPEMGRGSDVAPQFQAGPGAHFQGVAQGVQIPPNSFVASRHLLLQYWMKVQASQELPLGEYMGYGGKRSDAYFRSGFGCLDANFKKCFFIFAFAAASGEEYFHSFNDANFQKKEAAFFGGKWGHLTLILSTANPTDCPSNEMGKSEDACKGLFEVFLNGEELALVDWNHGESTTNAKAFTRGPVVPIWTKMDLNDGAAGTVHRRLYVSPPKKCASPGQCGHGLTSCNYQIGFPWPDPWTKNLFICDMSHIPSNTGGFGNAAKRKKMAEAVYAVAKGRVEQSCGA